MKKSISKTVLFFSLIFCFFFMVSAKPVDAASVKTLKKNTTYTTTLTGTKKYNIKYTETSASKTDTYFKNLKIYINGKVVKTVKSQSTFSYDVKLLNVSSKRTLLSIQDNTFNDYNEYLNIYEYKNGKFTCLVNLCDLTRSKGNSTSRILTSWARGNIKSVSTNRIVVRWAESTPATGVIGLNIAYQIKGSKITKIGTSHEIRENEKSTGNPYWTAKKTLKTYTTVGGSKAAFTIKAGEKVTLKAVTVKGGKRYLKLINKSGKGGWISILSGSYGAANVYFKEAFFAG